MRSVSSHTETALSSNLPRDLDTPFSTTQQKLSCFRTP
nr:MAG TPA: hypothetical protein [Caudoviricetes sp.]